MTGGRRGIAGIAVVLAALLALFLALRGPGGGHPAAAVLNETSPAAAPGGPAAADGAPRPGPSGSSRPAATSAQSAPVSPAGHADPLDGAAAAYAADRSGTVLAAVYDVRTGQSWRLGDGRAQAEASVVKLDILETLLARNGGTALPAGEQNLARAMIEDSDNDSATSLWDEAGAATGVGAYNQRAGLTRTVPSQCVTCAGFPWPGWGLTTTVPYDQLTLLKQLVVPGPRPLLSAAQRSYALSLMEDVTPDQRWGVSGGVPAGVTVALKNGWLPLDAASADWQVNSVGWVSGDGRDYLIALLTTGNPSMQYGQDTISALSSIIWSALR
ncbi:MAG TPA: serine hydrolase [Trebonia sp.]